MGEYEGQPAERPGRYEFDDVLVDRDNYRVLKAGQPRALGPRAFDLLLDLLQHPGRVVEKQELVDRVWRGAAVTDNALTRAVKELRAALGDDARTPRYLETVARRGYRLVAPVRCVAPPAKAMLAVLPFSDLSRDPEDYFCDGLTEEMISQIAQLNAERLGVIARTSAMAYKATTKPVAEIGRELGVGYVLEGSVRREGGRVRISAQLIAVHDQSHLWADSYEGELGDVLREQRRVAEAVARAVRVELGPAVLRGTLGSVDPEAYAAYLKGRYLWNRRTADSIRQAIDAFRLATSREPMYAPAYVGLARCGLAFILGLLPRAAAEPMARAALRRALELDDRLAEAHATLGAYESIERDHSAAERAFRHALMLDPNDPTAHHWYAMHCLVDTGRFEDALVELRRAQSLDPLALIVGADVGAVFCLMRAPARAIEQCRLVLELDSGFPRAHVYAGWAHSQRGELDDAVAAFETAKRLDDSPWTVGWLGYGYARVGRGRDAQRVLGELRQASKRGQEVALFEALVHAGLADTDRAIESLEQACAEGSIASNVARYVSAFDGLRDDPRFPQLVRRLASRG